MKIPEWKRTPFNVEAPARRARQARTPSGEIKTTRGKEMSETYEVCDAIEGLADRRSCSRTTSVRARSDPHLQAEEPRAGPRAIPCSARGRMLTRAVRLNNNTLNELTDLGPALELLLENPEELSWLDLSFNDLPTIDPILTTYRNLHCLQLHGNSIQGLGEVDKLAVLPHLRSLTLHGNPIEEEKGYRSYVLSTLPQLKSFDFSTVTKQDRSTAAIWKRMNAQPKKAKKKRERF
ncbi:PREDICTED: leucine-rich repeat-containing protein 51-like [Gavialis gangeticus]|uniref:leucine-rich repeat-containing protein 51-like n=1 Tax=Gavialis gangeticus TaxID=94835 RepID=UPI00092F2240|nr:PREDICTED: leucine-rich repeat-containing protein 51-like [Gavialis gangeticus]